MTTQSIQDLILKEITVRSGILPLKPAWVARDFLPPGKRLGLPEDQYTLGERGGICERWLASTTEADNRVKVPNEGLSYLAFDSGTPVTLKEAVQAAPELILGESYAASHPRGLDRLAKIFDYKYRIPYHLHQMKKDAARVRRNSKEEAYYFPEGADTGPEPETYLGVHPYIVREKRYDVLLEYLVRWDSDLILLNSKAYKLTGGDGFHIPAGIVHAPGSALTIELQEDSDVFTMLQAVAGGNRIDKELLFKDVHPDDRKEQGERAILGMIDWEANGDPYFYENHHTPPVPVSETKQEGGEEHWIFYNTTKFSGKKLSLRPGAVYKSIDKGVYNILVWKGKGEFGEYEIEAGNFDRDELLICYEAAVSGIEIKNTGNTELTVFKFFGPDINDNVPMLKKFVS
jgi:hypothetical protein